MATTTSSTTSTPLSSISGLASGIQWRAMIDQIIAADSASQLTPVTNRVNATSARRDAWNGYTSVMTAGGGAARGLSGGRSWDKYARTGGASSISGRTLLSATAAAGAVAGSYKMEVVSTAAAE